MTNEQFLKLQEKILRDREITKAEVEWYRKPWWVKQAEEGDYIPGLDDGEPPIPYEDMEVENAK